MPVNVPGVMAAEALTASGEEDSRAGDNRSGEEASGGDGGGGDDGGGQEEEVRECQHTIK